MGTKTGIEWTDSTWSPIRYRVKANAAEIAREKGYTSLVHIAEKMAGRVGQHCEHVSPGCEHCYAESNNHRCLPANGTGLPYDRRSRDLVEPFIDEFSLIAPLKWKSVWQDTGTGDAELRPRRIFVENQSDLFGEWVTDEMLDRVFALMALSRQHTYQVLTKRPERMLAYFEGLRRAGAEQRAFNVCAQSYALVSEKLLPEGWVDLISIIPNGLPNVWLGVSAENQLAADKRIPLLLKTPAAVRFISAEPLLGAIEINSSRYPQLWTEKLHWVIVGGESGPGARPMNPDWARTLRDQCQAAKVPFFFKQWGEWIPTLGQRHGLKIHEHRQASDGEDLARVGKKAAGALLDGREWKQFPEVRG